MCKCWHPFFKKSVYLHSLYNKNTLVNTWWWECMASRNPAPGANIQSTSCYLAPGRSEDRTVNPSARGACSGLRGNRNSRRVGRWDAVKLSTEPYLVGSPVISCLSVMCRMECSITQFRLLFHWPVPTEGENNMIGYKNENVILYWIYLLFISVREAMV